MEVLKYPWVARLADDLSDPVVIAATASEALRHGSAPATLGASELARARCAGQGDVIFAYGGVAVANTDHGNVCGRSTADRRVLESLRVRQRSRELREFALLVDVTGVRELVSRPEL